MCRQIHNNLPAKLARLTSYHEAKPLKLLKLSLENVGYKNFHFSIKITPLDFSKIRQHNDCTVVKPKIQNHLYKKKIHSQCFPKSVRKFSQCIAKILHSTIPPLLPPALLLHLVLPSILQFNLTFHRLSLVKSPRILTFNTNTRPSLTTEVSKTFKTTQNNLETKSVALSGHAHDNWLNSYD